ncbi:hypothetical protein [Nocardia sp. NBC_00511]|uniref:hypothetical protein n=1 Tax=Nocardia sp. NBC_00511 TaxID=2903591 RepID=UPI0030E15E78
MAARTDHDEIAAHALRICEDIREVDCGTAWLYRELAHKCATDPEGMAQVVMALASWVPYEAPPSTLADRAQAVADRREDALRFTDRTEAIA